MTVENQFAAMLDGIADPATKKGLVTSRRIAAPTVKDGVATVVFAVDGLSGQTITNVEEQIRQMASSADGISSVRIVRTAERGEGARTSGGPRLIAVASGKGGVGKSTVSANLAVALSRLGYKAGLIDADIHGPSVPTLFGTQGKRAEAVGRKLIPMEVHGVRALSVGMIVDTGRAIAWRGPMVAGALNQLVVDAEWGDTDPIVLDLPPGTGDIHLSLIQKHKPVGAVIVSTPQDLALIDARRGIDFFQQTDVPIIGLVENMSGYLCPHCGEASAPFGQGGAEEICASLGVPFLGRIPLDIAIRTASDAGEPIALSDDAQGAAFLELAKTVAKTLG